MLAHWWAKLYLVVSGCSAQVSWSCCAHTDKQGWAEGVLEMVTAYWQVKMVSGLRQAHLCVGLVSDGWLWRPRVSVGQCWSTDGWDCVLDPLVDKVRSWVAVGSGHLKAAGLLVGDAVAPTWLVFGLRCPSTGANRLVGGPGLCLKASNLNGRFQSGT